MPQALKAAPSDLEALGGLRSTTPREELRLPSSEAFLKPGCSQSGWSDPRIFWGDLDWSGMGILRAMRQSFPAIEAWPKGYEPMLHHLQNGQGHAPYEADKQGQNPVSSTGCPYADEQLVPALCGTGAFIDQELFSL